MFHQAAVVLFAGALMFLAFVALFLFWRMELATLLIIASLLAAIAGKLYEPPRL